MVSHPMVSQAKVSRFASGSVIRQVLNRSAFRIGLLAASAVAGYCAVLPAVQTVGQSAAPQSEALWTGQIEQPATIVAAPMTPITSASYTQTEVKAASETTPPADSKKLGATSSVKQKASDNARPARRPDDLASTKPQKTDKPTETALNDAVAWDVSRSASPEPKSFSNRWLSPVSDRLPSRGTLMRPFHMVGDAVHGLMNAF